MYKKLIVSALVMFLMFCSGNNKITKITGIINSSENKTSEFIKLYKFNGVEWKVIDSSKISESKSFEMNLKDISKDYYLIGLEMNKSSIILLEGNEDINIAISDTSFECKGSKNIQEILDLQKNIKNYMSNFESQMYKFSIDKNQKAMDSMNTIVKLYIDKLVEEQKGKYSSILLLNFVNPKDTLSMDKIMLPLGEKLKGSKIVEKMLEEFQKRKQMLSQEANQGEQQGTQSKKMIDLTASKPDGTSFSLSQIKAKYIYVDFWASWCGPCRKANPALVNAYNKFKEKGFDILSFSLDKSKDKWIEAISKDNLTWSNHISELKEWNSSVVESLGITSIPRGFLLDENYNIINDNIRPEQLETALSELIK